MRRRLETLARRGPEFRGLDLFGIGGSGGCSDARPSENAERARFGGCRVFRGTPFGCVLAVSGGVGDPVVVERE